jgi:Tfp pilus assembly protein PilN
VLVVGYIALAWALGVAASEGWAAYQADLSMRKAGAEAATLAQSADSARRTLLKSSELLVAAASVESSPSGVLADLRAVLPDGVAVASLKIEYLPEGIARVEMGVVARAPEAYDRFLGALSKSPFFSDIKPGSESRPGLVRATVVANHRPKGVRR